MRDLDKYVTYLRNVGRPIALAVFDEDWAPIGPNVRLRLKCAGYAVEHNGLIQLTPPSNTRGEIGDPS